MSKSTIEFKAGTAIELSFATVIKGLEPQVFGEYFPKVMPIVIGHGGKPLGSFAISTAICEFDVPKMGALFQWPNKDTFHKLHTDQNFLEIKHIRDDALSFFCNGNFFEVMEDQEISFEEGDVFALFAQWDKEVLSDLKPLFKMTSTVGSNTQDYSAHSIYIVRWDQKCVDLFETVKATRSNKTGEPEIFKFQFNTPK